MKLHKTFVVIMAVIMSFSLVTSLACAADSNAQPAINPSEPLTRSDIAEIITKAFGASKESDLKGVLDVKPSDSFAPAMARAISMGIISSGKYLRPNSKVTKEEAYSMLSRAFGFSSKDILYKALDKYSDKASISKWAISGICALAEAHFLPAADGRLNPKGGITKAEIDTLMDKLVKAYIDDTSGNNAISADGNVIVRKPGTIENAVFNGNLIIGDGVGNGTVTLENLKLSGSLIVKGGVTINIKGSAKDILLLADGATVYAFYGEATFESSKISGKDSSIVTKSFEDHISVPWTEEKVALSTGINMAYTVCGPKSGTPVILIHGVTDGRISWSQVAPMLAEKGYRVYVPEYRGNGKTDKPDAGPEGYLVDVHVKDMLAFMDAMRLRRAHIVGHSLGSLICQQINIQAKDRVLSTTLIDSAVKCKPNKVLSWAENGDGKDYLGVHGYDTQQKMPESFLKAWSKNSNEDQNFQRATLEHLRQMPYKVWSYLITGLNAYDNTANIGKVSGKVLVLWGSKDVIFTEKDQAELKAGLTGCDYTYVTIDGGSHNVYWDSIATRTEVVMLIDNFIKSLK